MAIRIQLRRDTAANWVSANPALLAGEIGIETDTLKFKIGNGNNWNDIANYANTTPSDLVSTLNDYILASDRGSADGVPGLDASKNLLIPGSSIIIEGSTDNAYETTLAVTDPTADRTITFQNASGTVAHTSDVNAAITTAGNDAQSKANEAVTTAAAYTDNEIDSLHTTVTGEISTHNSDSTNVHGIADTSTLVTNSELSSAVSNHNGDTTNVHGITDTSVLVTTSILDSHNSDTTSVHGIADTSQLATLTYVNEADAEIATTIATLAQLSGATFTGNITAPQINTGTLGVLNTITAGSIVIDGDLTVNGTTTTVNTSDLSIADNLIYLNEALEYSITTVSGNGTNQTYTTSTNHDITDAMVVRITGVDPSGYNKSSYVDVVSVTANTITVAGTETGTYVSGGAIFGKSDVNPDLGFVGGYNNGTYAHAGLVRDASANGRWRLFSGVTTEPTSAIDFTTFTKDNLELGTLFADQASIGDVTNTEIQYVHGVTSAIQTQIDSKQAIVSGVSDTEIGYLNGVSSAIQTQIDTKSPVESPTFTGAVTLDTDGIVFADGTQTKHGVPSITPIAQKTANYTLSSVSEKDTTIEFDSTSNLTLTIPTDSAVAFPIGASLDVLNVNTGLITIAGDTGVTVNATPGLKLRTQWSSATLFKRGSNSWVVYGDLKA